MGLPPPIKGGKILVRITLPLPPPELRSNARCHWAAKARATRKYRADAYVLTRVAMGSERHMLKDATGAVTFLFGDHRSRDRINLNMSLKAAIDGMVDAGLLLDDRWLTLLPPSIGYDKYNPRVVIEIRDYKYEGVWA